jgi:hypothetical protein
MKKFSFLFITILLLFQNVCGQKTWHCTFNFDDYFNCYGDTLWIDTAHQPNNDWEIGAPVKPEFQGALSGMNAIVTRLDTAYSVNDTSSFIIMHIADLLMDFYGRLEVIANYRMMSDTLTDFGTIEFSPDNGSSWIDLMRDTAFLNQGIYTWNDTKPVFSGNTKGWRQFWLSITDLDHSFNIVWGDTVLFKFTFISDSIQTFKDGWMLDDIAIEDWFEGISDLNKKEFSLSVYPNPISSKAFIELDEDVHDAVLCIYNSYGQRVREIRKITGRKIDFDRGDLPAGLYFLQLIQNHVVVAASKVEMQ